MLERVWYQQSISLTSFLLLPASFLFRIISSIRRLCYRFGILKTYYFDVPVIVVGNVTVGGTGKTPFTIWLANQLKSQGFSPAIVSRGYGGLKFPIPRVVEADALPREVGDEALLLMRNTCLPVVVGVNRVACVQKVLSQYKCDVIIADDGLQHYRLGRHIEIALVDGERQFGNKCLLPAGPLREPVSRLRKVDFVVKHNGDAADMELVPNQFISLKSNQKKTLEDFKNQTVHAVSAIGHPERFFNLLRKTGINVIPHPFPDHYQFNQTDFHFDDELPILMTEKDAVKCDELMDERFWYLSVTTNIKSALSEALITRLQSMRGVK